MLNAVIDSLQGQPLKVIIAVVFLVAKKHKCFSEGYRTVLTQLQTKRLFSLKCCAKTVAD